jgi:FAD/FMN-containing dehydrogenase
VVGRPASWGRRHRAAQRFLNPSSPDQVETLLTERAGETLLPYGLGRSYGDSCLNDDGRLVAMRRLDHFIAFDRDRGVIECEAGVSLAELIAFLSTRPLDDGGYWMLPVVPGTKYVTVGGAIANDVHGKNHESQGTFGRHVDWIDIIRSDGQRVRCDRERDAGLFRATIGGIGLTGVVVGAAIRLMRVPGLSLDTIDRRIESLDDYFAQAGDDPDRSYRAAWVDVTARDRRIGRGIHSASKWVAGDAVTTRASGPAIPVEAPSFVLSPLPVRAFNALYRRKLGLRTERRAVSGMNPVLFPLDGIAHWNRLYGRRGFYQHQSVVPVASAREAIALMLTDIARSGEGSALTVLKQFGALASPGLLSFPMEGTTLAVDFQDRGSSTVAILDRLEAIVREAGGRLYPAKDGRMTAKDFESGYPALGEFARWVDPALSSNFWRRMTT